MYLDLYKGPELKSEDLSRYDTPLVGFDEKIVTPEGQIKLSVVTKGKEVEVNFIMVNAFSPYTAILRRPWIHAMVAIPSTLHQKIKFAIKDSVMVVQANQRMARQCLVAAINHEIKQKEQVDRNRARKLNRGLQHQEIGPNTNLAICQQMVQNWGKPIHRRACGNLVDASTELGYVCLEPIRRTQGRPEFYYA